jgi:hypothetical protein
MMFRRRNGAENFKANHQILESFGNFQDFDVRTLKMVPEQSSLAAF